MGDLIHGPKRPLDLTLLGMDGNAFAIIGAVSRALKKAGASKIYIDGIVNEMMSADYNHLLMVAIREIDLAKDLDDEDDMNDFLRPKSIWED